MKYHNIFIAFMLCMGFSQMQAAQVPAAQNPTQAETPEWGSYLPSGLTSGLSSGYEQLKSMAGYATGKATSAVQSVQGKVQDIGYQKVATAVAGALWVASQFGYPPATVLAMMTQFVTNPVLLKQAIGTVASSAYAVATSPYVAGAAKLAAVKTGLGYLGTVDTQNKYKKLATEVVKKSITSIKISEPLQNCIATEMSTRLLTERQGDANITQGDIQRRFNDPRFRFDVLNACRLQEAKDSEDRGVVNNLIETLFKKYPALGEEVVGKEKWGEWLQRKQTSGYNPYGTQPTQSTQIQQPYYTQTIGYTPQQYQQSPQATAVPTQTMTANQQDQQQFDQYQQNGQWFARDKRTGAISLWDGYQWQKTVPVYQQPVYGELPVLQPVYRPMK